MGWIRLRRRPARRERTPSIFPSLGLNPGKGVTSEVLTISLGAGRPPHGSTTVRLGAGRRVPCLPTGQSRGTHLPHRRSSAAIPRLPFQAPGTLRRGSAPNIKASDVTPLPYDPVALRKRHSDVTPLPRGESIPEAVCDRRATTSAGRFLKKPPGSGRFAGGQGWLSRHCPLWERSSLAGLATAKNPRRRALPRF